MKRKIRCAPWWQLWMLVPVLGTLGFLEAKAPLSAIAHKAVEIGMVLLVNGVIWLWLGINKTSLLCDSLDGLAQTREKTASYLHPAPDDTARSNGSGLREPMWYVLRDELDYEDLPARAELDR